MHSGEPEFVKSRVCSRREMLLHSCAAAATFMSLNLSSSSAQKSKIQSDNEFGNFDFGLDETQEQRALRLHHDSIVIDMVQQGIGGYRVFDEPHLKALQNSSKDYMSLDAIYAEDIAGRNDIMRGRWAASGTVSRLDKGCHRRKQKKLALEKLQSCSRKYHSQDSGKLLFYDS